MPARTKGPFETAPPHDAVGLPPIAIVVSRYNATVTDALLMGAIRAYRHAYGGAGGASTGLHIVEAPGAYELIPLCAAAADSGVFGGVLALGCIIKGETRHDEFLAHAVTQRLADITLITGVPVSLGVLTVDTPRQALDRSGGKHGNKGEEAMGALIHTLGELHTLLDPAAIRRAMAVGHSMSRLMLTMPSAPDKLTAKTGRAAATGSRASVAKGAGAKGRKR